MIAPGVPQPVADYNISYNDISYYSIYDSYDDLL